MFELIMQIGVPVIITIAFFVFNQYFTNKDQDEKKKLIEGLMIGDLIELKNGVCGNILTIKDRTIVIKSGEMIIEFAKDAMVSKLI